MIDWDWFSYQRTAGLSCHIVWSLECFHPTLVRMHDINTQYHA